MKKLTGLLIILVVLVLGGFYGMGFLTETTIKNNIATINQTNGVYAEVEQYKRGWFCSEATVKWRLHIPERVITDENGNTQTVAAQDYQTLIPVEIHHGPFIYFDHKLHFGIGYAQTAVTLPEQYSQQFNERYTQDSIKPRLDLSIFISYIFNSSIELSIPQFKLIAKDQSGTFDWKGMSVMFSMSSNGERMDGELAIHGMMFNKEKFNVNLSKVMADYNLHQTEAGLYLGDARFSLPSLDVSDKDEVVLSLKELSVASDSDITKNLFSTHLNVDFKSIATYAKTYGPGELEMSLRNLDARVLAAINQQTSAIQNGTDVERQQAMMALLPEVPKLLSQGAEFEISKLTLKIPEGLVDGNLLVSLPKGDSANPFELIQKVKGQAKLKAPVLLVKQVMQRALVQQMEKQPELHNILMSQLDNVADKQAVTQDQLAVMHVDKQLQTMLQTGLIVLSGSEYSIDVNLEQGKFQVNGKSFNPEMLKF